jgi:hypothetical protein
MIARNTGLKQKVTKGLLRWLLCGLFAPVEWAGRCFGEKIGRSVRRDAAHGTRDACAPRNYSLGRALRLGCFHDLRSSDLAVLFGYGRKSPLPVLVIRSPRWSASRHYAVCSIIPLAFLISLVFCTVVQGATIENGFYTKSDDPSRPAFTDRNGNVVHLGQKLSLEIRQAQIVAADNANTLFQLSITIPGNDQTRPLPDMLVFGGKAYTCNGMGGNRATLHFSFPFSGAENATNISRYLNASTAYRKHPGYVVGVFYSPSKPSYESGEQVSVVMRIQNLGSNTFCIEKRVRDRGARDDQCTFQAWLEGKQIDDIRGGAPNSGGPVGRCMVKPGETFTNIVELNPWFAFDKPGTYVIHGSFHMVFMQTDDMSRSGPPIWDDYATAAFTVKITPPQFH